MLGAIVHGEAVTLFGATDHGAEISSSLASKDFVGAVETSVSWPVALSSVTLAPYDMTSSKMV